MFENGLLGSILNRFGPPAPKCSKTVSWELFWVGLPPSSKMFENSHLGIILARFAPPAQKKQENGKIKHEKQQARKRQAKSSPTRGSNETNKTLKGTKTKENKACQR